jgi:hypothetical protein
MLGFLSYSGPWALAVIFLVIALESSAFLGLFFPGEAVALIAGALVSPQIFSLGAAFATVATAAIVGDVVGYTLGHYWGQVVLARWSFARRQYECHRRRLEYYFARDGVQRPCWRAVSSPLDVLSSRSRPVCRKCRRAVSCRWRPSQGSCGAPQLLVLDTCWVPTGGWLKGGRGRLALEFLCSLSWPP